MIGSSLSILPNTFCLYSSSICGRFHCVGFIFGQTPPKKQNHSRACGVGVGGGMPPTNIQLYNSYLSEIFGQLTFFQVFFFGGFFPNSRWSGVELSGDILWAYFFSEKSSRIPIPPPWERKLKNPLGDEKSHPMSCFWGLAKRTTRRLVGIGFAVCRPQNLLEVFGVMGISPFLMLLSGEKRKVPKEVALFGWWKGWRWRWILHQCGHVFFLFF